MSSTSKLVMHLLLSDVLDGSRTVDSRRRRILRSCLLVRCSLNVYWLLSLGFIIEGALTVHIIIVAFPLYGIPNICIIFFDCLQLLIIFNIIIHIYRVGPRTPVIRPMLSMLVTAVPLPSCCVICVRWSG